MRSAARAGLRAWRQAAGSRAEAGFGGTWAPRAWSTSTPGGPSSVFGSVEPVGEATAAAAAAAAASAQRPPAPSALRRAFTALGASALLLGAAGAYVGYGAPPLPRPLTPPLTPPPRAAYDLEELEALLGPDGTLPRRAAGTPLEGAAEWACTQALALRRRASDHVSYFADPSSTRLLPDLPPAAAAYTRTLVLDLDGVLVKSDWTRARGWRTFKRPGADAFLRHMSQYYELVVFTEQLSTYGEPILERLDPGRHVSYRLYRDATRYTKQGKHCRDLSTLNRDLGRVVFLTADPQAAALQPGNALLIPAWDLDPGDTELLDLMPLLESVVRLQVPDTRTVLASYAAECAASGKSAAVVFRERSQRVAAAQREARPRPLLGRGAERR